MLSAAPYRRLRKVLQPPVLPSVWPPSFTLTTLAHVPPEPVHKLLRSAFRNFPKPAATWHAALVADAEYDPELTLLVLAPDGVVAAYVQSWTTGFIKDLVVAAPYRRQGLATLLMVETFARFAARGHTAVDLKVERKNKPAQKFYAGLGMTEVLD